MSSFKDNIQKAIKFLTVDLFNNNFQHLGRFSRWGISILETTYLSVKKIIEEKDQVRASALTYYSILSIVPVFAMVFGIAKGFGIQKTLREQLLQQFSGQETVLKNVIDFADNLLKNTNGGLIAGIGIVLLLYSVYSLMQNIESSFNSIWQVKEGRTIYQSLKDYFFVFLFAPIGLVLSSSITVFISAQMQTVLHYIGMKDTIGWLVDFLFNLTPYIIISLVFTFLYSMMPNTKVKLSAAFIAGIIAGTAFQVVQYFYIEFQVGVSRANAIYGSFAALPLFFIWLQISWFIVIIGAQLSFAIQNKEQYKFKDKINNLSERHKKVIAVFILSHIVKNFIDGKKPLSSNQISDELHLPFMVVKSTLYRLEHIGLLYQIIDSETSINAWIPAKIATEIKLSDAINAWDNSGEESIYGDYENHRMTQLETDLKNIQRLFITADEQMANLPANKYLKDI